MIKRHIMVLVLAAALSGLALPSLVAARATDKILLGQDLILPGWELVAEDERTVVEKTPDGYLLKNYGTSTFIYHSEFGYRDFDQLAISMRSDVAAQMKVIADITSTANYTFENVRSVAASDEEQNFVFSLHSPNFRQVKNFGMEFVSAEPGNILISEVSLSKISFFGMFGQAARDYFQVAPYSPYTVNVLPTPQIFGRPAFLHFLPVFLLLAGFLVFSGRLRRPALWGLLALWLVTDGRMAFEFLKYQARDYQTWVRPAEGQKTFRNYGDFYAFTNWLSQNLPENTPAVNFYSGNESHFPRIAQYYLYPAVVSTGSPDAKVYVVYRKPGMRYNELDSRLYLGSEPVSGPGSITASYDEHSFIFTVMK